MLFDVQKAIHLLEDGQTSDVIGGSGHAILQVFEETRFLTLRIYDDYFIVEAFDVLIRGYSFMEYLDIWAVVKSMRAQDDNRKE